MHARTIQSVYSVAREWALHQPSFGLFLEKVDAYLMEVQQPEPPQPRIQGGIAIIPLIGEMTARGDLGTLSTMRVEAQFRESLRSPSVGAILFDVDSPGGAVYYTDALARRIHEARGSKPIVAYGNGVVGSAAFWIASAADKLILAPGADCGSVGVWCAHQDMSGALEQAGVKTTLISSGKYKTEGNCFGPLDAEAMEFMQGRIDAMHDEFVQALARNRGKTVTQVRKDFGEGRLFAAKDAVSRGMADAIQPVDKVLRDLVNRPKGVARGAVALDVDATKEWLAAAETLYQAEMASEIPAGVSEPVAGGAPDVARRKLDLKLKGQA